jgi:mRNA interferase MazF
MIYQLGDIVLIAFPFSDGRRVKKRPAIVLLDSKDNDLLLARVTSQPVNTTFDLFIKKWREAGLLKPSYIRLHKLATIETVLVDRKLGTLSDDDLTQIKQKLSEIYGSW